jgi:chemotaxis protein histidine kinase CheA
MFCLFREELAGQLRILESGLAEIELGLPSEKMEHLLRAVHTIKGAVRVVGLPAAVTLAYAMEGFLSELSQAKRRLLPHHVDQLRQATEIFQMIQNQAQKDITRWVGEQEASIRRITQALDETEDSPFTESAKASTPEGETTKQAEKPIAMAKEVAEAPGRPDASNVSGGETPTEELGGQAPCEEFLNQDNLLAISSLQNCLLVRIGGESYALPMAKIDQVANVSSGSLQWIEGRPCAPIDGENMILFDAGQILNLPALPSTAGDLPVIVLERGQCRCGLVVEAFLREEKLALRPLDERLGKVDHIRAAAILGDGSSTLVLDPDDLLQTMDFMVRQGRLSKVGSTAMTASLAQEKGLSGEDIPWAFWRW